MRFAVAHSPNLCAWSTTKMYDLSKSTFVYKYSRPTFNYFSIPLRYVVLDVWKDAFEVYILYMQ